MGEEWSRPIIIVKNDRKIEPLNMPDVNKWVADPPRGWPLKILVYERNKFWRKFYVLLGKDENFFSAVNPSESPKQF